ncbi:PepSY-associated TM helix domain-containing protein [Sphingomonas sp.]|uniref:PepSY-associated TM helix domain-containing protein n=1 Tax=Sphingomonas sp. TaxID=28214 RepID=UPI00307ECD51
MIFPKLNQSGLLFVPSKWQRGRFIRWLKRIHAWTGFWGAALFFMMGLSGVLLNHREIWKIETGQPVEVSAMNIAVTPGQITDQTTLGAWAKREFGLLSEPRPPRKEGGPPAVAAAPETRRFMGRDHVEADTWTLAFNQPNGRLTVEYIKGSASVAVRQDAQNIFGLIRNLHKGSGAGLAWVLFMDSIAGALIAMSITGFLLWSRMHGPRLAGGGIALGSVIAGTIAVWPYLL